MAYDDLRDDLVRANLDTLLRDKTTKRNIVLATDSYARFGDAFAPDREIARPMVELLGLRPRILKSAEEQTARTRARAEVFTPAWLCRRMIDHLDETRPDADAKAYIDSRVLEITCGEAPFLTMRYDAATGETIAPEDRGGLLDRKLRAADAMCKNREDWLRWAARAYEATYGYEWQGDSLLLARVNLLLTFMEAYRARWDYDPTDPLLAGTTAQIANVIAWNVWQMDGLTGTAPYSQTEPEAQPAQLSFFDPEPEEAEPPQAVECKIFDWRSRTPILYNELKKGRRAMKFDFVIGNPPYQEESGGDSTGANPVYHVFYDSCIEMADRIELITPARFLFNAGKTPKAWNEKMLKDQHFRVLYYEQNPDRVFPGITLTGGVVVSYYDKQAKFQPIGTFIPFNELRSIIDKVTMAKGFVSLREIIYVHSKFDLEKLYSVNPSYRDLIGNDGNDRRVRANALEKFDFFHDDPEKNDDIRVLGLISNKRGYRFVDRSYLEPTIWVDKFKLFVPESNGASGMLGETAARIISKPQIGNPGEGVTQTFIVIGSVDTLQEARNIEKYVLSKFARVMLGALKATQRNNSTTWAYVPMQDFTPSSDIDWTKSVAEIDRQLYRKYGLSQDEIDFIESHVKEMA